MSEVTVMDKPSSSPLPPAQLARRLYGTAFDARDCSSFEEAQRDWADLPPADREFILAHLAYLQLQATRDLGHRVSQLGRDVVDATETSTHQATRAVDELFQALGGRETPPPPSASGTDAAGEIQAATPAKEG